jgi:predicted dehydrogenase/threonine dehydrogenase-like Zn-dependent dehydrogenase
MKQVIQNYHTGRLELIDAPVPLCASNSVLVRNHASLISMGTERSIIELAQKSLLGKARMRPDLVRQFMNKAKKEGFLKTFQEALNRLDNPVPLGYSSAGVVMEVGTGIHKFSPGDRVACIGAGYAVHAEYISVPENLCCRLPDGLPFEEGSFGMLGIIALHGIRCAGLSFGSSVAVIGLGLLGLLTVQILKSYGCKVTSTDIDSVKVEWAKKLGIEDSFAGENEFKGCIERKTRGHGVDAVIITAATKSDLPVHAAVDVSRFGGKVVIVGVADIHPQRNEMWHKEVEMVVSRAGGPGTFDPVYEKQGVDYPIGAVRWTENRNLEEFLELTAERKVDVHSLISHRFALTDAETVYRNLFENRGGPYVGVVLEYPQTRETANIDAGRVIPLNAAARPSPAAAPLSLGVIGAGLFGKALFLPALQKVANIRFHTLSTSSSASAVHTAKKYGFTRCTSDYREIVTDREIGAVLVLTPHSMHARMVVEALEAGKHVFVEKPLCVNDEQLLEIRSAYAAGKDRFLMVGYNRRFSPHAIQIARYLSGRQDPLVIHYRINAGFVPADHWVHEEKEGGSRVIGEICHFVDFMQFLTGSIPARVYAERVSGNNRSIVNSDNVVITLKFEDGSVGNITYSAAGDKAFSREQVEIFSGGTVIVSTDFKQTALHRGGKKQTFKTASQQMGYREELQHFTDVVLGHAEPRVQAAEQFQSTAAVFCIARSLETGKPVSVTL